MTATTRLCFRSIGKMYMGAVSSRALLCLLAAATALSLSSTVSAGELFFADEPIPGQYIVVLRESAAAMKAERSSRPSTASVAREMGKGYGVSVLRSYDRALRGFVVKASDRSLARLVADPRVAYVEEDGVVRAFGNQTGATWGLDRIDQRSLPLSGTYGYDTDAATVNAYIIDSGIYAANNDFGGRVSGGMTAINDGNGTNDCNSHGTHVAGTVGGTTWGVAKNVRLHPVRVLDCNGSGELSGVIAGLEWVAANHIKPAVANMSLGASVSQALDDATTRLVGAGVMVVVAAGNDNADACTHSPARAPLALTVAATGRTDARAYFSNFGSCVDLFAPGLDITSAGNTGPDSVLTISGTSMASPHAAGAAALYLALNPNSTPAETTLALIKLTSSGKVTDAAGSPNRLLFSKGFNGVNGPIFPNFTATNVRLIAKFTDRSTTNSGTITNIAWEFGDGGRSTAINPTHVYRRSGTYSVTETVTNSAGYIAVKINTVTIR
ncbi:MAG: S8 family serine peptidase [Luteimonas sp.]